MHAMHKMTFILRLQIFQRTRLPSHFLFAGTMGTTSCNVTGNLTSEQKNTLLIIFGSTSGAGVIVCVVSVLLVLFKKLYKKLVYRLALYQVLSSLLFSTLEVLYSWSSVIITEIQKYIAPSAYL